MNHPVKNSEFTEVFERITDAFVALDKDWRYTYMNKKAGEIFDRDPAQMIGKHIWTEFPEGIGQPFHKAYEKAMKDQHYVYLEEYYPPYDRWFENHIYPSPEGLSIFFRDITERKKTELALKESQLRYHSLIDQASDAIMITDTQGNFIDVNMSMCRLFGYTKEELLKLKITSLIDPQQLKNDPIRFDILANGLPVLRERRMMHKNGTIIEVEANVKMLPDGRVLAIARDITDRKKTDAKIEASEKKLRQVLSSTPDIFYVIDLNYNVILINEMAERNLEKAWHKPVKVGTNLFSVIPKSEEPIRENFEKVFAGERIEYELQVTNENLPAWVLVSLMPVYDESGVITGAYVITKDISERKKAEQAIKESEARYRALVENAPEALVVFDVEQKRFVSVSESAVKFFKMSKEELLKVGPIDLSPDFQPDGRSSSVVGFEKINQAIAGDKPIFEWTHRDAEGNLIPCEVWLVRLPSEKQVLVRGSIIDITERKKSQELIIRERDLSDSIINSLPGVFYLRDLATGKCLRWNKNFETVTGKTGEEIAESLLYDCIAEEHKDLAKQAVDIAIETNEGVAIEANLLTKFNGKIPYYITGMPINYENKACLMGTGIDISARKKAEEELRESEQKYKLLFESNPLPMFMFSRDDLAMLDVNESAIRHYGYSKEEFLAMKATDLRPPEDVAEFLEKVTSPAKETINLGTWKHRKKNGKIISVEIIGYDITYQNKPARLTLANDVTEKLAAEEKLKQSYNEVRRLTNYLQNIREEERTHIAREIHDELGQQLTVLKMDASWLNKKFSSSDEAVKEKLKGLLDLLDSTVKTVRRISSELRPSLLDDLGLTAAIEWHLKEFEKRSGIQTSFFTDEAEISLPDEIKTGLFRIFQESLTNVARHAEAKKVNVTIRKIKDELVLSIEDDGKGFDKFKAAGKKTLGVLGMQERSEMMGGNYQITSQPGKGTIVTVSVPFKLKTT